MTNTTADDMPEGFMRPDGRWDARMVHMAATGRSTDGTYGVVCRCGWAVHYLETRGQARTRGDAHLAEANGVGR